MFIIIIVYEFSLQLYFYENPFHAESHDSFRDNINEFQNNYTQNRFQN